MRKRLESSGDSLEVVSRSRSEHQSQSWRPDSSLPLKDGGNSVRAGSKGKALPVSREANVTSELKRQKLQVVNLMFLLTKNLFLLRFQDIIYIRKAGQDLA